ncbi:unnamed protein product [Clonostachys chloroleuca]|uniref:C2H2-type domain-containing protein n=1 Tax=Clonostachys chloroleuca TaxID=1926264 RepID=A0AA35QDR6_9HYPO|nr:unnamed protein product [Clonostachys chloroleuca]
MDFNSPYGMLDGENGYSHADADYQPLDLSALDPTLGEDGSLASYEQATIRRFLEEDDSRRLWEMNPTHWPETPSMGTISYPATPTLEPNDRSSTPGSLRLPSLPPNSSRPVTRGNLQRYGESQRPLTPLDSVPLTSAPGAFSEEEHSTPRAALMGLSITEDTRDAVGNTIHVQTSNLFPSSRLSLGPNANNPFPLREQNLPVKAVETIEPVSLMSPPMQPYSLPNPSFTRPLTAVSGPSKPKNTGKNKNKNKKQQPKTSGRTRVLKPSQGSTVKDNLKANTASNMSNGKFTAPISRQRDWECKHCDFSSKDHITLKKHEKSNHVGPFSCIFEFAGCNDRFSAKNEWKRHVLCGHVVSKVNVCSYGVCADDNDKPSNTKYIDVQGRQFNRKDLYDCHMRRVHTHPTTENQTLEEWECMLKALLRQSWHIRCSTPTYMECPSPGCNLSFEGDDAWDQRMEHTARHMEKAATGEADDIVIGGDNDHTLIDWASLPEVGVIKRVDGEWEVCFASNNRKTQSQYNKRK